MAVPQILRFALVGGAVAALYVLLYLAFLHLGLPQQVSNAVAFLLAVAVQYVGQAGFTFQTQLNDSAQMTRFAIMILCGLATSALLTGFVGPALALPDWASAVAVTLLLPVQNYLIMTQWVFADRPHGAEKPQ